MNKGHFCSRKGGAMIKGEFYPVGSVSDFLGRQIKRQADKMQLKTDKRVALARAKQNRGIMDILRGGA